MALKIKCQATSEHRNVFVVTASGYYGDMDETYHQQEKFSWVEQDDAEELYRQCKCIQDDRLVEIPEHLESRGFEECQVSVDCAEMLPNIDELSIHWYDAKGSCHDVEVS